MARATTGKRRPYAGRSFNPYRHVRAERGVVWLVEEQLANGKWLPVLYTLAHTRSKARKLCKDLRERWPDAKFMVRAFRRVG